MQILVNVLLHKNNTLHKYQPGDIITCCPNDQPWGWRELTNPAWRIIQDNTMNDFVASIMKDYVKTDNMFIKRLSHLDLSSSMIDYDFRRFLMDDKRRRPIYLAPFPMRLLLQSKLQLDHRIAA